MKYLKAEAPFTLKDGKTTKIRVYHQAPKEDARDVKYMEALMVTKNASDKMVLKSDAKALLPYPSRGAVLDRSHDVNLAGITELKIHPEMWDELVKSGKIDVEGNPIGIVVKESVEKDSSKITSEDLNPKDFSGDNEPQEDEPVLKTIVDEKQPLTEVSLDHKESENTREDSTGANPANG